MSRDTWEMKKLGDVCETGAGGTPLKDHKEYYKGGTIPWLRSGEVNKKNITTSELFITNDGLNNSSAKLFPEDTVLIAMYGATAGQVGILRFQSTTNQAVCGIFPNKNIIPEFIYYFFLFHKDKLVAQAVGGAQPNISQIKICNTIIPVPPLDEQKRIVTILDQKFSQLEALKAHAQANLQNAKDLFQSELTKTFSNSTWGKKKLGDVCEISRGGSPRPIQEYITKEKNGINWIKIGDTDPSGKYIYSTAEKIRPEGIKHSRYVESGDFLLSNSMSFGRPYILKTNGCIHDGWLVLKNYDKSLFLDFFYYLLLSPIVQQQFDIEAKGSTVRNLNTQIVSMISIPVPPLPEQRAIVARLDSLNKKVRALKDIYTRTLSDCDELKQSFLSKAFAGEL